MKFLRQITHLSIALISCGMVLATWMYFFDGREPVKYTNLPFPVSSPVYKPGERIQFLAVACRAKQYPFTIHASLVDGFILNYAPIKIAGLQPGCRESIIQDFTVPEFIEPGMYKLQGLNVFHVNALRDRIVPWETTSFRVE